MIYSLYHAHAHTTMKFPVSVNNKKNTMKMTTEKLNKINRPFSNQKDWSKTQRVENPQAESISDDNKAPKKNSINTDDKDAIICDNMTTLKDDCPEDCGITDVSESSDGESKFALFKRISLDRSISWDDSGFNSCTSDDKEEAAERLSVDSIHSGDDDDENARINRQFPARLRQRSCSLDSESSSEFTECHFQFSRPMSLSVNNSELERSLRQCKDKLFDKTYEEIKLNDIKLKDNLVEKEVVTSEVSNLLLKPATPKRRHLGKDVNNNRQTRSILKNLKSYKKSSSHGMNRYFQDRGLLTLVACIFYTLFLGFIYGLCELLFRTIKLFMSKEDLQDLRDHVSKSRQNGKQTLASKSKVVSRRQSNTNKT